MNDILELLDNGQWAEAIERFKNLNISGRDMGDYLDSQTEPDAIRDIALLGFYSREWKPKDNK